MRRALAAGALAVAVGTAALPACTAERPPPNADPSSALPTRTPNTPSATPTPSPLPQVTVTIAGDIMLGRRVGERLAQAGDLAGAFRFTGNRLARADITVGNLESTLSRLGAPRQGDDSFAADPGVLDGLTDVAGFDVLSLANNHTGDFGERSLVETARLVENAGIRPVGAGASREAAWRPAIVERSGVRFGFLAFNAIGETPAAGPSTPGAASVRMQPRTGPLSEHDLARAERAVRELAADVDVVIVLPHWGDQYTHRPVRDQRIVARALVRAGADAVVGGHPHWTQPTERHRGGFVVYSLGNFVFDMDWEREVREGNLLELTFTGDRLTDERLVPYLIGFDFVPRFVKSAR
jgi:poly-gamma-glutamate capsule biosynthesis protein CapA/YwtB (metallophosphatase superfamily)